MPRRKVIEGSEQEGNSYAAPVDGFDTDSGIQVGINYQGSSEGETVTGSNHSDTLLGNEGADTLEGLGGRDGLSGGAGDDTLDGGAGDDSLRGGEGHDTLTGGAGDDTFFFEGTFGHDTVTDFNSGDNIDLSGFTHIKGLEDLSITMVNGDTVITVSETVESESGTSAETVEYGSITLKGVDSSTLSAEDFEFYTPPQEIVGLDGANFSDTAI